MKWLSSWRLTAALFITSIALMFYLAFFWTPPRPKVAAKAVTSDLAQAIREGLTPGS